MRPAPFIALVMAGCAAAEAPSQRAASEAAPDHATGGGTSSSSATGTDFVDGTGGGATEQCNGLDDNDNGQVDEGCICAVGDTQACYDGPLELAGIGACHWGEQTCVSDTEQEVAISKWGTCSNWGMPGEEICADGSDNDCDGATDEDCDPPDDPCAVGRTLDVGCGRVFVWGDEHVASQSYWPDPDPFWSQALEWLADPGSCNITRSKIGFFKTSVHDDLKAALDLAGFAVSESSSFPTSGDLASVDIAVIKFGLSATTAADGATLQAWVDAGGALMTMTVGWGSGTDECSDANPALAPLGLAYHCFDPAPWGPVSSFGVHPIATGLAPTDTPFVNGRFVVESQPVPSHVVASISGQCPP